jgi:hypothetical protein
MVEATRHHFDNALGNGTLPFEINYACDAAHFWKKLPVGSGQEGEYSVSNSQIFCGSLTFRSGSARNYGVCHEWVATAWRELLAKARNRFNTRTFATLCQKTVSPSSESAAAFREE